MDWLTLILTMMVGIIGIRYLFFRKLKKFEQLGILHKKPWPILGNFAPAIFRRWSITEIVDQVYWMDQDANYVGIYNMFEPVIVLRTPELIKSITVKNFDHFVDHCTFLNSELDPLLGKSVFGLCGEKWKEVRNLLTPAFTSSKMKSMFHLSFPTLSKLLNLTFIDPSTDKFFTSVVKETIDTRDREGITRPDMLQLMMDSRGNKSDEGHPELTIREMTAQAFGFFFAGFDTVSSTMCFAAYEIAIKEDVQKKLQEEVDEVMEKTNGELTYEALSEMEYLDAVISETLRLYPVAPFLDRICVKKFEMPPALPGGKSVIIEPGQNVWMPAFCLHRDAKYFPDPTKFDPGRFMGTRKNDIKPFTYFPFGLGPRMCLGNRFALLEIKVMFFNLLSKCHLKPSPKTRVPLKFSKSDLALTPEGGFWIQLEPRNSATRKFQR